MQDMVFSRPDIVDSAAEKMPATNIPGKPGSWRPTFMTKYGTTWSIFLTAPAVKGSQFSRFAYITKPMSMPSMLNRIRPAVYIHTELQSIVIKYSINMHALCHSMASIHSPFSRLLVGRRQKFLNTTLCWPICGHPRGGQAQCDCPKRCPHKWVWVKAEKRSNMHYFLLHTMVDESSYLKRFSLCPRSAAFQMSAGESKFKIPSTMTNRTAPSIRKNCIVSVQTTALQWKWQRENKLG